MVQKLIVKVTPKTIVYTGPFTEVYQGSYSEPQPHGTSFTHFVAVKRFKGILIPM